MLNPIPTVSLDNLSMWMRVAQAPTFAEMQKEILRETIKQMEALNFGFTLNGEEPPAELTSSIAQLTAQLAALG